MAKLLNGCNCVLKLNCLAFYKCTASFVKYSLILHGLVWIFVYTKLVFEIRHRRLVGLSPMKLTLSLKKPLIDRDSTAAFFFPRVSTSIHIPIFEKPFLKLIGPQESIRTIKAHTRQ